MSRLVKPPRWAWNRNLLEPANRELARGLVAAVPMWESSGSPVEVVAADISTVRGSPTWGVSPSGISLELSGTDQDITLDDRLLVWKDRYADGFTLRLQIRSEGSTSIWHALFANAWDSSGGDWSVALLQQTGTGDLWAGIRTNGSQANVTWSGLTQDRTLYDIVFVWDGSDILLYADGVLVAGPVAVNRPQTVSDAQVAIGAWPDPTPTYPEWDGSVESFYQWDRPLNSDEISRLAADPFGLIRRNMAIPSIFAAVGDQTLNGVLFSPTPVFPTGSVDPQPVTTDGVLFSPSPVFPTGSVDPQAVTLAGVLFAPTPVFPTGSVDPQALTIAGVLFSPSPVFPTGIVTPGPVTIAGVLFAPSPVFPVGQLFGGVVTIAGVLFSPSPVFPVGQLIQTVVITTDLLTAVIVDGGPTAVIADDGPAATIDNAGPSVTIETIN